MSLKLKNTSNIFVIVLVFSVFIDLDGIIIVVSSLVLAYEGTNI